MTSKVLQDTEDYRAIASIMVVDPVLLDEWTKLADELGLDAAFQKTHTRLLNYTEITYDKLFQAMIAKWVNTTKSEPTAGYLCFHLERAGFKMVAGKVRKYWQRDENLQD